jgi:DNA-binding protein HU-alpha
MAIAKKTGTTTTKTTTKPIAKPTAVKLAEAGATPVGDVEPTVVLRKKELFERVTEASGAKKRDVRLIVEATLKVLGDALAAGETLALPPFGKAKVNRQKDLASGEMLIVKLRRDGDKGDTEVAKAEPLAAAAE